MLRFALLLSLLLNVFVVEAYAAPFRRLVNFEWEVIEGATSYEIELKQSKTEGGKTFKFKTKEAVWNGRLTPGNYMMRLRALDYRGVPGDWSPDSDFNVGLEPAVLKSPAANAKIDTKENSTADLNFEWAPVGGADKYHFEIASEDGKTKIDQDVTEPKVKVNVPVASNYTWKVTSSSNEGINSEAAAVGQISVLGKAVEAPKVAKPESDFVRELKWSKPDNASGYDVYLFKYDRTNKKWDKYKVFENYQSDTLPFDEEWPGGKYQLVVKANSNLRGNSPVVKEAFSVREGNRSPAAEYTALVRRSIERTSGLYGIASYLITDMQFSGSNQEKNSHVAYNALGGTARIGLGWWSNITPWGWLAIIDMSGFTLNNDVRTFASAELNAVYKMPVGDRGELRLQGGPYYKELPVTIGDPFSNSSESASISAAGPHAGAEYWYSITPKFGIQVNAHLYYSLMKVSTPNGAPLNPSLSTQFGFLGSYRFTPTFTGLAGYARREDRLSYKAVPSSTNFAVDGDVNESTIVGNYLNLFAEWSF